MKEQVALGKETKGPELGTRGREGNRMTIPWAPGIPKRNTRRNITPPAPIVMEEGADLCGYHQQQQII